MGDELILASASALAQAPQQPEQTEQTPKSEAAQSQKPEYYEFDVDGKKERYTQEDVKRFKAAREMDKVSRQRFEESARERQKNEAFDKELNADFIKALQKRGLSNDQIRQKMEAWYHENFIEPEMLNEDQKRNRELERQVKEFESERQTATEKAKAEEEKKYMSLAEKQVQQELIQMIEKSKLPKTAAIARQLAYWKSHNLKNGWDAPDEVIVQQVREQQRQDFSDLISQPVENIIELVGEEFINKVRKFDLARLQQKFGAQEAPQPKPERKTNQRVRSSDVDNYFSKLRQMK